MLKLIFHSCTFKVENERILNAKVNTIQIAFKKYLAAKHARVAALTPKRMTCPISLSLFENPVVASDGNTYEYYSIHRVLNHQRDARFPMTGPLGVPLLNKTLVANLSMRSEVMEFRELHKLAVPQVLAIPAQHVGVHTPAPVPQALRQGFQPQTPLSQIFQMVNPSLPEMFKIDGFLNTITMAGLNLLLQHVTSTTRDFLPGNNKGELIGWALADGTELTMAFMVPFVDNSAWLGCVQIAGLNVLLRSLELTRGNQDESKDSKIYRIRNTLPLKITIEDRYGSHEMVVKRSDTVQKLYAETLLARSMLKIDGTPIAYMYAPLSHCSIKYGSVIENQIRAEVLPPAVAASGSNDIQDATLMGFLLDKAGEEHVAESVIIMVKDPTTMEEYMMLAIGDRQ